MELAVIVPGAALAFALYYIVWRPLWLEYKEMKGDSPQQLARTCVKAAEKLDFLAKNLPLGKQTTVVLRKGEDYVFHLADVSLIESRPGTRETRRSGGAITLAAAKGLYLTAASGRSESPAPDNALGEIDQGRITFTTHRVVFAGSQQSREWNFSKVLGWDEGSGRDLNIAVSNRQKVSCVTVSRDSELTPGFLMQLAEVVREEGWDAGRSACASAANDTRAIAKFVMDHPNASHGDLRAMQEGLRRKRASDGTIES